EPFVCKDDQDPRPARDKEKKGPREPRSRKDREAAEGADTPFTVEPAKKPKERQETQPLPELPRATPSEQKLQLEALEKQFLKLEAGLDPRERQALWPQLAQLYAALETPSDAGLCWAHALWEDSPRAAQFAAAWVRAENKNRPAALTGKDLDRLLAEKESLTGVRLVAASVVAAAGQEPPPADIVKRLRTIQEFLQKNEGPVPVRVVWLVALAMYKLSHGDLLALTRTRDRLLERLFKNGLSAEQDLPTFLRFAGARSSDRFRAFRDWLLPLPDPLRPWIRENPNKSIDAKSNSDETEGYASLILAFGLARLGEEQRARELETRAFDVLSDGDEVHRCLLEAFGYRIQQALEGKPATGPLP